MLTIGIIFLYDVSIPHRYDTNSKYNSSNGSSDLLVSIPHRYDTNPRAISIGFQFFWAFQFLIGTIQT